MLSASIAAEFKEESLKDYNTRMQWFADSQYGMFIHFGLYSMLGGEWQDERIPSEGKGARVYSEWIMGTLNIERDAYAKLAKEFNPVDFDAEAIVSAARNAGMMYLVITSKHHDGFCLWDSDYTDYDLASTPIGDRDLLMELKQACDKYGMRFGLYYSILDWHHPSQARPFELGMKGSAAQSQIIDDRKQDYIDYQRNQVLELIEKYEPAVLWFDGDWVNWWTLDDGIELYNAIREADQKIIVNNRVAKRDAFELDYVTQEQKHFDKAFPRHWEGCYTMNNSWGYKKGDDTWKSAEVVYKKLKDINEKGGALLLNVGPDGRGVVQPEAYGILAETAELLRANPIKKSIPQVTAMPGVANVTDPDSRLPNIILILTDDQGLGDFSFRGHPYLQTPNLDRLVREGTVYQQYYANGSVCSPTRASLMTSRYPARDRVHGHFASHKNNAARGMPNDLDPGGITITDALKAHGYTTAHIGKWHLGDTMALAEYGIDFERTVDSSTNSLEASDYWKQFDQTYVDQYFRNLTTHAMAHEACKFIEASQNRPFYINFWSMLPHATLTPTPEQLAVYAGLDADPSEFPASWMRDYAGNASNFDSKMQIYAASVTALDEAIGILMNKLDELGLSENTLILMTSDNGPEDYTVGNSSNAGVGSTERFRGRKRSLYEGGVRSPCIVRWPGHVPIGKVNSTSVMSTADWFPTVIGALGRIDPGITMPALTPATDGEDMSDVLLGSERLRNRPLHWEWRFTVFENADPLADYTPPPLAIRDGPWKFFVQPDGTEPELYDVLADPGERTNLAALPEHSGRVAEFTTQLQVWKATLPP